MASETQKGEILLDKTHLQCSAKIEELIFVYPHVVSCVLNEYQDSASVRKISIAKINPRIKNRPNSRTRTSTVVLYLRGFIWHVCHLFLTCQVSIATMSLVSLFLLHTINLTIILSYYRKVQIFF